MPSTLETLQATGWKSVLYSHADTETDTDKIQVLVFKVHPTKVHLNPCYIFGVGINNKSKEKGMTEDEMVGWHHLFNGHEFEQNPGDSGQGRLVCCSPWGCKESDTTEQLKNNNSGHSVSYVHAISFNSLKLQINLSHLVRVD